MKYLDVEGAMYTSKHNKTIKMFSHKVLVRRKQPEILIIGGGAAGIAAAQRLYANGFTRVKIIEAEKRLGGRIRTIRFGGNDIDLGAHWVHGEEKNVVNEMAGPKDLLEHSGDFNDVNFVFSDGTEMKPDLGMMLFEQATNLLEDVDTLSKSEGSVLNYINDRVKPILFQALPSDKLEAFYNWLVNYECSVEGCDFLEDASAKGLAHYQICAGDLLISWKKGGYHSIIEMLLSQFYKDNITSTVDDTIILNCEVSQLDWTGMGVLAKCNNGKVYYGDNAIVTVSLGVLKERSKTLFDPPLPDYKRKAIAGLGIGTVNKIYLQFPYTWWPKDSSGFSLLWLPGQKVLQKGEYPWELEIIGFYPEKRAVNMLSVWLIGKAAKDMEGYSDEQVKAGCYRVLKKFLSFKFTIPEPIDIVRSSWYSNPHFRGSYSYRSINSDGLGVTAADLAKPLKNHFGKEVLLFAGEATHSSFYSTVHGAIESGWREADRLTEIYHFDKLNEITKSNL
nr:peroxisomal N(1)-acetyl-spermine/spermidine oxidase isoform X2 [Halyomorpha halys]